MKKFLITLLILILLCGTAFMFGWAQLSVPPGQYGIINSKTHGIDQTLVRSGEFRWIWYKLIPTNVKIIVLDLEHNKFPISFNSSLPSGSTYSYFVGLTNADFSWDLKGEIAFNINPDMLISLAALHGFTDQEGFNAYLQKITQDMETMILRSLSTAGTDSERLESLMAGNQDMGINREITAKYPEILDFSLIIQTAKYPDFILYRQLRLLYEEYLSRQRDSISTTFTRRAENRIETHLHFEELERYGELLTKYPVLLEYLALEKR